MMARMRSHDIPGKLAEGFEGAPLHISPDGGIAMSPEARELPPPPRICEQGPCRNYHRFTHQLDAEQPIGGDVEQGELHGKVTGDPGPKLFYKKTHHYCYPTAGIELELGEMPMLECNRWDPIQYEDAALRERRDAFYRSPEGRRYREELAEWRAALEEHQRALESATSGDLPTIERVYMVYEGQEFPIAAAGGVPLISMCDAAVHAIVGALGVHIPDYELADAQGNPITNLQATLHDLGIVDGERFILTRKGA